METPRQEMTRYDPSAKRQSLRKGRETGVWIFIPAVELRRADVDPQEDPPLYRVWGTGNGSVMLRLYT